VVKSFENASNISIKFKYLPRRDGDLDAFWADSSKAFEKMSWQVQTNINNICDDT